MGWDKAHKQILRVTFCEKRQQVVPVTICIESAFCPFQGRCYPCFYWEVVEHKVLFSLIIPSIKICSSNYDWHEWRELFMH